MPNELPVAGRSLLWATFQGEWPDQILELRVRTWKKERQLKKQLKRKESWSDSHDFHARHLLYVRAGTLAGAVRYCMHHRMEDLPDFDNLKAANVQEQTAPLAAINRLVMDPGYQGSLVGGRLAIAMVRFIESTNAATLLLVGTSEAQRIAQKLGFEHIGAPISNPYLNGNEECRVMRKLLPTA